MFDAFLGFLSHLVKLVKWIHPYFFPPEFQIISSKANYGPYKNGRGREGGFVVRIKFRLTNEDQLAVLVKNLEVYFDGRSLDLIENRSPSLPGILTSGQWEYPATGEQIYWGTLTLEPARVTERLAFFKLPNKLQDKMAPIDLMGVLTFSRRRKREVKFTATR